MTIVFSFVFGKAPSDKIRQDADNDEEHSSSSQERRQEEKVAKDEAAAKGENDESSEEEKDEDETDDTWWIPGNIDYLNVKEAAVIIVVWQWCARDG